VRTLITGGFGFIGGRLALHFQRAGHLVRLASRYEYPIPKWLPAAEVRRCDWSNSEDLERLCSSVDLVIHAAGMNSQDCANDPVRALEANGLGTARLFEAAKAAGAACFVYLSTAHLYASPLVGVLTEDCCPQNLHPYATSHRAAEDFVLGNNSVNGMAGLVLRLSNVFGVPAHKDANCWTLLVNDLCRQAAETGSLYLNSSGLQQRNFIPIADLCAGVDHLAICRPRAASATILNFGGDRSFSVRAMAELVAERCNHVLGFKPPIIVPHRTEEPAYGKLDYRTDRLNSLGFVPESQYGKEIDELLIYCRTTFS
jgi:UDP-glucose 4-epimerase